MQIFSKVTWQSYGDNQNQIIGLNSLIYWPNWNSDIDCICSECITCKENQQMPPNIPKFQVSAKGPGEVYGCDITDINGKQHLVLVDYFSCCIFERKVANLISLCVMSKHSRIFSVTLDLQTNWSLIMLLTLCLKNSQNLQWIGQFNMSHLVQDSLMAMHMLKKQ